ncbi:hypothetical protein ACU6U9_17480 [Pseudomonas sp. HK3]
MLTEVDSTPKSPQIKEGSVTKGVIWGSIIDVVGTTIFGLIFGVAYATFQASQGVSEQEIIESLVQVDMFSIYNLIAISVGLLISFYAGYLCAKKSGEDVKKSTTILCLISCFFGIAVGATVYSLSELVVLSVLTIGAIILGANRWQVKSA